MGRCSEDLAIVANFATVNEASRGATVPAACTMKWLCLIQLTGSAFLKETPMFKIGKLFHLTHVVDDLGAVDKWYDEIFGVTRFYRGYESQAGRDASLI